MREMTISIVQSDIESAVMNFVQQLNSTGAALPLEMTAGRGGKGFTASLVLNQELIESAIVAAAKKTFIGDYDYRVELSATRGEDGFTGTIYATAGGVKAMTQGAAPVTQSAVARTVETRAVNNDDLAEKEAALKADFRAAQSLSVADSEEAKLAVIEAKLDPTEEMATADAEEVKPVRTGIFGKLERPSNEPTAD